MSKFAAEAWSHPSPAGALTDPTQVGLPPRLPIEEVRSREISEFGYALEQPTDQHIARLHADDPRISAIHGPEEHRGTPVMSFLGAPGMRLEGLYSVVLSGHIVDTLRRDFPGEQLKIRSVQASLDGPVDGLKDRVADVRQILQDGDITDREIVNLADFDPDNRAELLNGLNDHVVRYASTTGPFRQRVGPVDGADRIFPVLLVYNQDQVAHTAGYKHALPADRASLIRGAYVLDAIVRQS